MTTFKEKVYLGKIDGINTYLAAPSWDCDWYWGFGYIQNRHLHTHFNSYSNTNMKDYILNMFDADTFTLDEDKTWKLCELMRTFYILKETAGLYNRGGTHYTTNPLADKLKNDAEYNRINKVILPQVFDEIYKLFKNN